MKSIDLFFKVIDPDDDFLVDNFGKLIEDYESKNQGQLFNTNLFFVYNKISDIFLKFKIYIIDQLLIQKDFIDKSLFLNSVKQRITYIKYYDYSEDIDPILNKHKISFSDFFDRKKISRVLETELKYDYPTINDIKDNFESDRLFEQKYVFYHQILAFWRRKALDFIDVQYHFITSKDVSSQEKPNSSSRTNCNSKHRVAEKSDPRSNYGNELLVPRIKSKTDGFTFYITMNKHITNLILDDHHNLLVKAEFINKCKTDFKAAYNGKRNFYKIIWNRSFPELRYYIEKLSVLVQNKDIWVRASKTFLKPDGKEFTNRELAKTKSGKRPISEHKEIDDIFFDFFSSLDT